MIQSQAMADTLMISPQGITAAATASATLDCIGAAYATIRVALSNIVTTGTASANGVTVQLKESNDTNSSNFTTFVADQTGFKFGREVRYEVDLKARKRYLVVNVVPGTAGATNEPVTAAVFATLSRLQNAPTSTSGMIAGTNDVVVVI